MIKKQDIIIKILTVLFPDAKIILFGSRARGDFIQGSDLDIAIDNKINLTINELEEAKNVIEALNIPYQVDVVDLNNIPEKMKALIIKEGIIWKN